MLLCVGITLNTARAADQPKETPLELPGGHIVTTAEVRILIEQGDIFLADCRSPFNYGKGHLPGARPLEYQLNYHRDDEGGDMKFHNLNKLPENRKTILIFYSHGTTGWKSYRAAAAAIAAGYTQVHWYRGGIQAWLDAGHPLHY
jgi:rhodanese-related sulfurtransferase